MQKVDFLGRGVSFPVKTEGGKMKTSFDEDIVNESISIILSTRKGERLLRPDFGADIMSLVFSENNAHTANMVNVYVREALEKWEPRIEVEDVTVTLDSNERNLLNINIEYQIRSSNSKRNLVYPFYLEGSK
jgi:hypothetical protein